MFCPECGSQNRDVAKFCIKCGYNYNQFSNMNPGGGNTQPSNQSAYEGSLSKSSTTNKQFKKSSNVTVFTALLLIILSGLLVFIYVVNVNSHNLRNDTAQNFATTLGQREDHQQQIVNIVNESFSVNAGQFISYKFSIPEEVKGGTVTGSFTASGGSNDIYVVITNKAGITNLKNGNQSKGYYNSGKVTTDDINVNLAPGTYYIVFSNAHSIMTPKSINATIKLSY
jgi:hypothetical protein